MEQVGLHHRWKHVSTAKGWAFVFYLACSGSEQAVMNFDTELDHRSYSLDHHLVHLFSTCLDRRSALVLKEIQLL